MPTIKASTDPKLAYELFTRAMRCCPGADSAVAFQRVRQVALQKGDENVLRNQSVTGSVHKRQEEAMKVLCASVSLRFLIQFFTCYLVCLYPEHPRDRCNVHAVFCLLQFLTDHLCHVGALRQSMNA